MRLLNRKIRRNQWSLSRAPCKLNPVLSSESWTRVPRDHSLFFLSPYHFPTPFSRKRFYSSRSASFCSYTSVSQVNAVLIDSWLRPAMAGAPVGVEDVSLSTKHSSRHAVQITGEPRWLLGRGSISRSRSVALQQPSRQSLADHALVTHSACLYEWPSRVDWKQ